MLRLISSRKWNESCLAGAPVPEPHRCAALHCESLSLTQIAVGTDARVTCLDAAHSNVAAKLASMGILPGAKLRLVRRSPAFVFRIDYSEFAVDRELAAVIRVAPE
ncbi:MAG TPA: FeoA family protein [Longimicrobiales bacterium]|nr:FeoA family protein [Longimicrobiales bacterium]